jgi:hypothetical protein
MTRSTADLDWHQRLINASIAAMGIRDGELAPDAPGYGPIGFERAPRCFEGGDPYLINAGFLGETKEGHLILAFRGTISDRDVFGDAAVTADWDQDKKGIPTAWTVNDRPYGKTHEGFTNAITSIWDQILKALDAYQPYGKEIWITGHSKGGAMSLLAASRLKALIPDAKIKVVIFAAPMAGDRTFGQFYKAAGLEDVTVRYLNEYDIVPELANGAAFQDALSDDKDVFAAIAKASKGLAWLNIAAFGYEQRGGDVRFIAYELNGGEKYRIHYGALAEWLYHYSIIAAGARADHQHLFGQAHQPDGGYLHCFESS